jgi:hypothetical protein
MSIIRCIWRLAATNQGCIMACATSAAEIMRSPSGAGDNIMAWSSPIISWWICLTMNGLLNLNSVAGICYVPWVRGPGPNWARGLP